MFLGTLDRGSARGTMFENDRQIRQRSSRRPVTREDNRRFERNMSRRPRRRSPAYVADLAVVGIVLVDKRVDAHRAHR
jgi:hypothetical protein